MTLDERLDDDWADTRFGPRATWTPRLAGAVESMRACASPMGLAWGSSLAFLYNDALAERLGLRPEALGADARQGLGERWSELGPLFEAALTGADGVHDGLAFRPFRDEFGAPAGVLVSAIETPVRRIAGELVRTLVDHVPSGVVVVDANGTREILASNASGRLLLPPGGNGTAVALEEPLSRALRGEIVATDDVLVSPTDAGGDERPRRLSLSAAPVRDATDNIAAAVAVFTDVSERFDAADLRQTFLERERQARAEAEEANRVKDEFLAMLGHELRNPLAPISTALELMRLRGEASSTRERAVIERQVQHLVRLVDDLLDISRITRGKVELKRTLVDMSDVIARAIELASPLIEQRQHNLVVQVPRGLLVVGDATRLAQAVSNLLTNAAKYTEPGGNIGIDGLRTEASVLVRVSDNGRGLTPELSARVFELFFQERQSLDRSQGGLGLGLAIVRTLVEAHGGSVSVASEGPGQGSAFTVRLPEAVQRRSSSHTSPRAPRGVGATTSRPRAVLVVDDNVDAAELLSMGLTAAGHLVEIAHDGPSALERARTMKPEVAILDIGLPVMDGYELARNLLDTPALEGCRLIAVTGYGLATDRQRSREAGFARHLVKPVSVERVLEEIDAIDEAS